MYLQITVQLQPTSGFGNCLNNTENFEKNDQFITEKQFWFQRKRARMGRHDMNSQIYSTITAYQ